MSCPRCDGKGWWASSFDGPGMAHTVQLVLCEDCDGKGTVTEVSA